MTRTRKMTCKNKTAHGTHGQAFAAMRQMQNRTLGGLQANIEVYKCGNHYHFGHSRPRKS